MAERPEHNPYPTETHRQRAITTRLLILIGTLGGVVIGLALKRGFD